MCADAEIPAAIRAFVKKARRYDVVECFAKQPYCNGKVTIGAFVCRIRSVDGAERVFAALGRSFQRRLRILALIFRFSTTFLRLHCSG